MLGLLTLGFAPVSAYGQAPTPKVGSPAPDLASAISVKGRLPSTFKDGKVHIVEFWATWCARCRESFPRLSEIARKYADRVDVTGIDVAETSLPNHN